METKIQRARSVGRRGRLSSLNSCFLALGASYEECYRGKRWVSTKRPPGDNFTLTNQYTKGEMLSWAKFLHHKAIKKFHPDRNRGDSFYEKKTSELNFAYDRIKHILNYR